MNSHFPTFVCILVSQGLGALESTLFQIKPQTQCDIGKLSTTKTASKTVTSSLKTDCCHTYSLQHTVFSFDFIALVKCENAYATKPFF